MIVILPNSEGNGTKPGVIQAAPLMRSIQWKIGRHGIGGSLLLAEHTDGQG